MAGDSAQYGTGGMVIKLAAGKIAMASGCRGDVAGKHEPLTRIDQVSENTRLFLKFQQ